MNNVDYYGCYDYNEEWYLIKMLINEESIVEFDGDYL